MNTKENNEENSAADESFRDKISTVDKQGRRLWIFPQKPFGKFHNKRIYFSIFLLTVFFGLPFIKFHGEPFFMLNILERKFIIYGVIFWPQDFFLFGLAMLTFMVFVVLFTVVYGRLWCGWSCPQTVFMELIFRKVEYLIEGDAASQKLLNKAPMDANKFMKKSLKHGVFFLISFIIANNFLAYIIGIDELFKIITGKFSDHAAGFISLCIFSSVFYFVFAFLREQICIVICPYGRLQGVLMDKHSIVVAYDYVRGETRSLFKKNENRTAGDCIDCHQCVKVCPTGIDIRNGTQLECVQCTACIDACDHMMSKVGFKTGLIRYASENNIRNNEKLTITPRIAGYSVILLLLVAALAFGISTKKNIEVSVLRTPGMLFQELPDNKISNLYNYKLFNKSHEDVVIQLKNSGDTGSIKMIAGDTLLKVKAGNMVEGEFFLIFNKNHIKERKTKIGIDVYSNGIKISKLESNFMGRNFNSDTK